jgi:diketogulonate reductase-like aldo/keto reductase
MIGFGTYKLTKDEAYDMTLQAIKMGYRVFDTAEIYRNEKSVQKAFVDSKISRDDLFLTCKLSTKHENNIEKSFKGRLKIFERIDLVLLHWVSNNSVEGWRKLVELQSQYRDRVKYIGISNISKATLLEILKTGIRPYAVQNEFNPYCKDFDVVALCRAEGIKFIAHSCFSFGHALEDANIKIIAEVNGYKIEEILLRWAQEYADIVLTRCNDLKLLEDNFKTIMAKKLPFVPIDVGGDVRRMYYYK